MNIFKNLKYLSILSIKGLKAWISLSIALVIIIAVIEHSIFDVNASNSTETLPPKSNEDLTHQDRVLIKLTASGTTAEANVSPKNIMVKIGTTVVWENLLPEKVYVQSKPDANHYEGELLNGSYFFPGESREAKLDKIGTFIYDGSNGFGSYYVRGTITVVQEATEEKQIPNEISKDQSTKSEIANVSTPLTANTVNYQSTELGLTFKYPTSWKAPIIPDYKNCFKNSDSCNVSFGLGYKTSNNTIQNFIIGVRVNSLEVTDPSISFDSFDQSSTSNTPCLCDTLDEYIKWDYNRLFTKSNVMADNSTTLGKNYPAWQLEVLNKDNGYKTFVTWAINGNLGYRFIYSAPVSIHYDYYLEPYKNLLDSVIFTGVEPTEPIEVTQNEVSNKPSFLSESKNVDSPSALSLTNETSNSTSKGGSNSTYLSNSTIKADSKSTESESNTNQDNVGPPLIYEDEFGSQFMPRITYENYTDNDLDFSVRYPSDWTIGDEEAEHYTVASFDLPKGDATVNIRIFPKGDYKSIKDFGDREFKKSSDGTLLEYYRNGTTLLSGKPALKAIYLTTYNPSVFEEAYGYQSSTSKAMMVATMVPEKKSIYAIVYFAESMDFDSYRPIIEDMVKSFQIEGKGPVIQED